jgi:hypothetical protein
MPEAQAAGRFLPIVSLDELDDSVGGADTGGAGDREATGASSLAGLLAAGGARRIEISVSSAGLLLDLLADELERLGCQP